MASTGDFRAEVKRLTAGRELNEFDDEAVKTVAGLTLRIREAREVLDSEGVVTSTDRGVLIEHPAAKVERMASAEIRGWVKDRPDLFGERKAEKAAPGGGKAKDKFGGFKVV